MGEICLSGRFLPSAREEKWEDRYTRGNKEQQRGTQKKCGVVNAKESRSVVSNHFKNIVPGAKFGVWLATRMI